MASKQSESDVVRGVVNKAWPYNEAKPTAPAKLVITTDDGDVVDIAFYNAWDDYEKGVHASPPRLGEQWAKIDPARDEGRRVQAICFHALDKETGQQKFYEGRAQFTMSGKGTSIKFLDDAPATPAPAAPTAKGAPPTPTRLDPTRDSIERQVAAKGATDIGCAVRNNGQHFFVADWDAWFDHIIARIQNTPAPVDVLFDEEVEAPVKDDDSSPGDAVLGTV